MGAGLGKAEEGGCADGCPEVDTSHVELSGLQHRWGRAQVCSGDLFYSGDLVSSWKMGSGEEKWGFQAQKIVELSPGPRGCRVCGKCSQQPTGSHPAASSPSAHFQPLLAGSARFTVTCLETSLGWCPAPAAEQRSILVAEASLGTPSSLATLLGMAVPGQVPYPTSAQHGSLPNTSSPPSLAHSAEITS